MCRREIVWTPELVAERFKRAVDTSRRLPRVRVQGYFSVWPSFVREAWERLSASERPVPYSPPSGREVDAMVETMLWVQWLDEDQRHTIWMRAQGKPWKMIGARTGCDRVTAWRRWRRALFHVSDLLNAQEKV